MTERRLNMIIEKEYFDSEEVRKANAMNDKTMAPPRRIRLTTRTVTNIMPKLYL
mgnify:CR=1 FL=1